MSNDGGDKNGLSILEKRMRERAISAEYAVVGSCMVDDDSIHQIGDLDEDDLMTEESRYLIRVIRRLAQAGRRRDTVTISEELARIGALDKVGGTQHLFDLASEAMRISGIAEHAQIVRDHAVGRRMRAAAAKLSRSQAVGAEAVAQAHELLAATRAAERVQAEGIREVLKAVYARVEARLDGHSEELVPTGIVDLDAPLGGGLPRGSLTIVAGRPSMGKTVLGFQIARNASRDFPVLAVSIEQSNRDIGERLLAAESKIDQSMLRNPALLSDEQWHELTTATGRLGSSMLHMVDSSRVSCGTIHAEAEKLRVKTGKRLGVIVVDYLQLMEMPSGDKRNQQIGEVTKALKLLAKLTDCAIVLICQLNRALEARSNKRPIMSDLRDSGEIEQDADVIAMAYRDEYYDAASPAKGVMEIGIVKQRNGPTCTIPVCWVPGQYRVDQYRGPPLSQLFARSNASRAGTFDA